MIASSTSSLRLKRSYAGLCMTPIRAKDWNYPKQVVARISVVASALEIGLEETLRTGKA